MLASVGRLYSLKSGSCFGIVTGRSNLIWHSILSDFKTSSVRGQSHQGRTRKSADLEYHLRCLLQLALS